MAPLVRATEKENGGNRVSFQSWRKHTHGGQMLDCCPLDSKWVPGQEDDPDVNYRVFNPKATGIEICLFLCANKMYEHNKIKSNQNQC